MALIALLIGALLGAISIYLILKVKRARVISRAHETSLRLVAEAKEDAENLMDEAKLSADEGRDEIWSRSEREILELESRVQSLDENYRRRRSQIDRDYNQDVREIQKQLQVVQDRERYMAERQVRLEEIKSAIGDFQHQQIEALRQSSGLDADELKHQIGTEILNQIHIDARKKAALYEEDVRANSEEIAKRLIGVVLSRFPRVACTERGIGVVEIPNEDVKKRMLGPDNCNILLLQKLCEVEISLTEYNTFSIASFDPVRREISTRCLEKLLHERAPDEDSVARVFERTSGDVARKMEADGNRIAAELGQKDLHIEIKRMLGTLRYRYSFAQNQHFHVAEVGWLCGLLASELGGVELRSAKRAGLLHDVGKAMDHAIEGGHAVIGADFIQRHGEKENIVHAVRSHHYEEQPSTDLAFLVIAADAISGARPGARRSTVNAYNQKIEALNSIADSFRGVTKTLILNAGREVRVLVDARRVNDEQSLFLCRQIADKIEDECQYPGQIKVVVIRETHAEAMAK
jgi:ribonuclease Y